MTQPIEHDPTATEHDFLPRDGDPVTDVDLSELSPVTGGSSKLNGYLAVPSGDGPWPGVVLIHELFGLDANMRRSADRLADAGYLTLAVNLFTAGGKLRCLISSFRALSKGQGQVFADIETARQWLLRSPQCTKKIGVIGFCIGGGFALLTANTGFDVVADNYGHVNKNLEASLEGACPVVANYGARDRTLPGAAAKVELALTKAAIPHDVKNFPTAGHAFLNETESGPRPLRPVFRVLGIKPVPEAAPEAWARIEEYFARYLR